MESMVIDFDKEAKAIVSVPLRGLGSWKASEHRCCTNALSFSPLAGIRFVESSSFFQSSSGYRSVSVPLRGLGSWKDAVCRVALSLSEYAFQSPCGD